MKDFIKHIYLIFLPLKTKKIKYTEFVNCKSKMNTYYKYYKSLDDEGSYKNTVYQMKKEDVMAVANKDTKHVNKMIKKFILSNIEKSKDLKTTFVHETTNILYKVNEMKKKEKYPYKKRKEMMKFLIKQDLYLWSDVKKKEYKIGKQKE